MHEARKTTAVGRACGATAGGAAALIFVLAPILLRNDRALFVAVSLIAASLVLCVSLCAYE